MIIVKSCLIIMISILSAAPVIAQDIKLVESEGQVTLGDETTIGQGKAAALNNARRAALEKATGVSVHGSSLVYNNQLINDLVLAASRGVIVEEQVLENECHEKDKHLFCTAKIKAGVKPLNLERRGSFAVTNVYVQRPDKEGPAKSAVFQNNDEIQIRAAANEDSYLHIFSVDQYGGISRLFPNSYVNYERVAAGKELLFPDQAQRKNGLKLKVRTPKKVPKAVESVLVIATKKPVNFLTEHSIENPTITDLMRELSVLDPSQWVESTAGYEVRE